MFNYGSKCSLLHLVKFENKREINKHIYVLLIIFYYICKRITSKNVILRYFKKYRSYCLESCIRKLVICNAQDDKYSSSRPRRGLTYLVQRYTSTSNTDI